MRDELHLMELVDRYLDGSMNAEERTAFEARANTNSELRQLVEDQRVLREGVARLALRGVVVRSAPSGGRGWIGPTLGTVVIIAVATYAWMNWKSEASRDPEPVQDERMLPSPAEEPAAKGGSEEAARIIRRDTIVRVDTQIVVKRIMVPANITDEMMQEILDSVRTSAPTSAVIEEARPIVLQNVLTPDGDGHNDRLIVPGGPYLRATMVVRSARNELVFTQETEDPVWNGDLTNGKPAPEGTYQCEVTAVDRAGRVYSGREAVRLVRPNPFLIE